MGNTAAAWYPSRNTAFLTQPPHHHPSFSREGVHGSMEIQIRKLLLPALSMPPWCAKIPNCTNLTLPDLSRKQLPGSLPLGLYIQRLQPFQDVCICVAPSCAYQHHTNELQAKKKGWDMHILGRFAGEQKTITHLFSLYQVENVTNHGNLQPSPSSGVCFFPRIFMFSYISPQ